MNKVIDKYIIKCNSMLNNLAHFCEDGRCANTNFRTSKIFFMYFSDFSDQSY